MDIVFARFDESMDPLSKILTLSAAEREARGLVHTPQEIFQQPETWWRTYERVSRVAPELERFLKRAGVHNDLPARPSVFLIGAGTSDYIGKTVATLLRGMWECEVCALPSTDLLTGLDDFVLAGKSYLWVSFSRSGDSSEGVALLESALDRRPDIHHVIVCCNAEGQMVRTDRERANVCRVILDDEVNDRGLAMTSSFSNMVVTGQCLAHLQDLVSYGATLNESITAARKLLPAAAELTEELVAEGFAKMFFLGSGALHGVAVESALKVMELTAGRVVTFSESFLGLRHGPLSALDDETLVVGFVSGDARRRSYELDLLEEVRDKKVAKNILATAPRVGAEDAKRLAKIGIMLPIEISVGDCYRPPVDVIVGQLLGLFSSISLGLKPDAPSPRGVISRVVSKIRIY
jgi:tagatose-6-phosphate ketose/aldose isomerase